MKYVVTKPIIMFYAFGGCYPIHHETKDFIFYTKTRGNGDNQDSWEEKINKKNILFYCDEDISFELSEINASCWKLYKEFENTMKTYQQEFKNSYGVKQ